MLVDGWMMCTQWQQNIDIQDTIRLQNDMMMIEAQVRYQLHSTFRYQFQSILVSLFYSTLFTDVYFTILESPIFAFQFKLTSEISYFHIIFISFHQISIFVLVYLRLQNLEGVGEGERVGGGRGVRRMNARGKHSNSMFSLFWSTI